MKAIRNFNEFIKLGIVKKQSPDWSRAEFLINESEISIEGLKERTKIIPINEKNANSIVKDCYDIIMELVRAKMLLDGFNAAGQGAHEAEISYMRIMGIREKEIQFADQIRYFRNGMIYYGTMLDTEYAEKVVKFTNEIYPKLIKMLK
ncbi:hypothetical protein KY312_03415 [Candidatus Woesearchaeota archaeon]|nr:hypothetical protein [Candidatus Woesearchaeota archaeon]